MKTLVAKYDQLLRKIHSELQKYQRQLMHVLANESDLSLKDLQSIEMQQLIEMGAGSLHQTTRDLAERLERLDAAICADGIGMYGTCTDCEEAIALYDLEVDPAEPRCFDCRQKHC